MTPGFERHIEDVLKAVEETGYKWTEEPFPARFIGFHMDSVYRSVIGDKIIETSIFATHENDGWDKYQKALDDLFKMLPI